MKITHLLTGLFLCSAIVISCNKADTVAPPSNVTPVSVKPEVGKAYDGGIVVYVDSTGSHGMMVTVSDMSVAAEWGCEGTLQSASGASFKTGSPNTNTIVSGCNTAGIAARVCFDLNSGGHSDWSLPSRDELDSIYINLYQHSIGSLSPSYYWSSTEEDANRAWFQFFGNGAKEAYAKSTQFYVRPVRFF